MTMLDAKFVVAALILNMFSTFIILSVINPTRPEAEPDIKLEKLHESQSFLKCWASIFWPVLRWQ